jgi:hypothetical protein
MEVGKKSVLNGDFASLCDYLHRSNLTGKNRTELGR